MNKNKKPTDSAPKKLTVEDLKRVIGGNRAQPTVEGNEVEDSSNSKASGSGSKASSDR
jgi:hypothetical protein